MKVYAAIVLMAFSTMSFAMDEDLCEQLLTAEIAQLIDITSSDYVDPKDFKRAQDEIDTIFTDKQEMSACEVVILRPELNQKRIRIEGEYLQR